MILRGFPLACVLVAVFLCLPSVGGAGALNANQIEELLFWHNKARADIARSGRCANMLEMEWEDDIAVAAQSNLCPGTHNGLAAKFYGKGLGENLAWSSDTCRQGGMCSEAGVCGKDGILCETSCNSLCTLKNRAYLGWYQSETDDPASSTDNCKSYANGGGHCTQVVWQNSNKLGCSYQSGCARW